jgi:Hep_Hag.
MLVKKQLSLAVATACIVMMQGQTANALTYGTGASDGGDPTYATAIGTDAEASGYGTTAVGWDATASGADATAVGKVSRAGDYATSIGRYANAAGAGSVAVGIDTTASGTFSTAVGAYSAAGENSTALGAYSTASGTNSVALGKDSEAVADNVVSVGNDTLTRKIIFVTDGDVTATSTDAVNGSQLFEPIQPL